MKQEKRHEMATDDAPEAPADSAPGEASAAGDEARLQELMRESKENREQWLRAEAELANFRKRAIRDREEAEQRAKERMLGEMLSLADDLERALDAAEQAEQGGPITQGVRLVHGRVRDTLRAHGVQVIDPAGMPFDPHDAEAILELESATHVPGTIVSVVEKGYRIGDRLLRPAKVIVARAQDGGGTTLDAGEEF
jgi:molecular chaperone GrpE